MGGGGAALAGSSHQSHQKPAEAAAATGGAIVSELCSAPIRQVAHIVRHRERLLKEGRVSAAHPGHALVD